MLHFSVNVNYTYQFPTKSGLNWGVAEVYAVLGEKVKAINSLELVYKLHGDFLPWMVADIYFKPLRDDPGFKDIVQRLKIPG